VKQKETFKNENKNVQEQNKKCHKHKTFRKNKNKTTLHGTNGPP